MNFLKITILLFLASQLCRAQDTTIVLSASTLNKANNKIKFDTLNGWIFKQGNDTDLAKLNISTIGWEKLMPAQLTSAYRDKNGRVEGWFRIKLKFDSSLLNKLVAFDFPIWVATELYIDGELVASRGKMGNRGNPFIEYNGGKDPFAMVVETKDPHVFTIHFAGYISPIPPYDLKSNLITFVLLGPNYYTSALRSLKTATTFSNLWVMICGLLSVLFWLFYFQNRQEKNLFWVALCVTVLTLSIYFVVKLDDIGGSNFEFRIYTFLADSSMYLFLIVLIPLLLIKVFKKTMNCKLITVLVILLVLSILADYVPNFSSQYAQIIQACSIIVSLFACSYYIITSWKVLKGAQWAIVIGLFFPIFLFIFIIILISLFEGFSDLPIFIYLFFSCLILSLPLSLLVYVSLRFKEIIKEVQLNAKKVIELSEEKKIHAEKEQILLQEEVGRQTAVLRATLENLKSTQAQLIQSEKMASLGELTAGIAHEIQNPLNFVNNFSEVSNELIEEMKVELDNGDIVEAKAIASDISLNLEKISHHGKRADAIVKGMLQHSRNSSGQKEPTDINAMCDEYLRLSYHGLRAKDKSFNATIKTDFDQSIGKVSVNSQDIGRVVLNLLTNAFYAVSERRDTLYASQDAGAYEPTVFLSTKRVEDKIEISIADNGNGIPQNIVDKIFQPFFTTKPTGQGTGLGLSLSYDIITKGHGGELRVETLASGVAEEARNDARGSIFTIILPISSH